MHTVHVLTVSSALSLDLLDALLTQTEGVLRAHGATRIWIDPAQPETTVVAEFPDGSGPAVPPDLAALADVAAAPAAVPAPV